MEAFTIHLDRKLGRRGGKNPLQRSPRSMKSTDCHGDLHDLVWPHLIDRILRRFRGLAATERCRLPQYRRLRRW
jgi:hypothetical protein